MNISKAVKNSLRGFYITKKYAGNIYSPDFIKAIFNVKTCYGPISKYIQYSNTRYRVKECFLVERKHAVEYFFPDRPKNQTPWDIYPRHLTGTNLYVCSSDDVPFYKQPRYGYKRDWLYEDIEERHINKTLKNYTQVIQYLRLLKKQLEHQQIQLQLPFKW